MRRICAWCGQVLAPGSETERNAPISHGICCDCARSLVDIERTTLRDLLDSLDGPILLVDAEGRVLEANGRARAVVGGELPSGGPPWAGNVIRCVNAYTPQGCGRTEFCRAGCVIRRSFTHTHATGESVVGARAAYEVQVEGIRRRAQMRISTEKAGDLVLLRIDELG